MRHENLNFHNTVPCTIPSYKKKLSPITKNPKVPKNIYLKERPKLNLQESKVFTCTRYPEIIGFVRVGHSRKFHEMFIL